MSSPAAGGASFSSGECSRISGHDAVDERVVELDAALLERLLEDVVDERRLRLVARFVARERDDRRVQILIVQQREERDLQPRVRAAYAGPRVRESPGYSMSPTRTPDCDVRRRRAVDDHLRSAVVDVVVRRHDGDARRLEADLKVLRRRARQRAQSEERLTRRRHDDARGARLQLGHALLAERPRHAHAVGIDPVTAAWRTWLRRARTAASCGRSVRA